MKYLIALLLLSNSVLLANISNVGRALEWKSQHPANQIPSASALIIGAGRDSLIVTKDTTINGDLTILRHGAVVIRGATLEMHGNIFITDSASLTGEGGTLSFPQDYLYQRGLVVVHHAHLSLHNTVIDITTGNANAQVSDSATWEFHHVTLPNNFFTMIVMNHGTFIADSCSRCGEFVFQDTSASTFTNSGLIISWPWIQAGQSADVTFPDTVVSRWAYPDSTRSHSGIFYNITYRTCHDILWMILHATGASMTIRNSSVRAIGVVFRGGDSLALTGIANGMKFSDWTFPDTARTLRLINSTVATWNYYPFDAARLSLANCIFGELLATGVSNVHLTNSTCDATGGYFSATDSAHITGLNSLFSCQVVSRMRANIFLVQSTIWTIGPYAAITAERAGGIVLANCSFNAIPTAYDTSLIVIVGVDPPAHVVGGKEYDLIGGADIIPGPNSVVQFRHYSLSAAPTDSVNFHPIGDIVATPVVRGVLGRWRAPSAEGIYQVKLCIAHNFNDSICVSAAVQVDAPSSVDAPIAAPLAMSIAPQPSHGDVRVFGPADARGELIVVDMLGRVVRRQEITGAETHVNLDGLPRGIYRVVLPLNGVMVVHSLVVE